MGLGMLVFLDIQLYQSFFDVCHVNVQFLQCTLVSPF